MSTKTVSVICFSRYGKLLFCNVRNAPRGCALRRTRQMSQAIYVSLRPLLNKRHWRENVPRACLENHFRNLQAPLCGIFYPHSVAVARYAALIRIKSPTNWDSQLTKSLFQTRSSETFYILCICFYIYHSSHLISLICSIGMTVWSVMIMVCSYSSIFFTIPEHVT